MSQQEPAPRDVYSPYEAGLRQLLDQLGPDHPRYADALTYEQRLTENINQSRLSGDTETRRSERTEIIRQLNELALDALEISFNDIYEQASLPPPRVRRPSIRTLPHLTINRVEAIELFAQLMEPDGEFRMMRLMGESKMGKSHLVTKVFPRLARETHAAYAAVLDLRNSAQTIPDVLHAASSLLGGVAEFPAYFAAHKEWLSRPRSESKGFEPLLTRTAKHAKVRGRTEDTSVESSRWVYELTDQFVADLSMRTDRQVALLFDAVEAAADSTRAWLMETLLVRLTPLAHLRIVVAGRRLPEASGSYAAVCLSYELPPVREKEAYLDYSRQVGANLDEKQIDVLVTAFDHNPGLFADVMPKFMSGEAAYA